VLAGFVLNHLPDPRRAASECARVLTPGGRLALAIWERPSRSAFFGVLDSAMSEVGVEIEAHIPPGPDPYGLSDDTELTGMLRGAGLQQVEIASIVLTARVRSVADLLEGVRGGTVRAGGALRAVSDEQNSRLLKALENSAAPYRAADGFELPAVAKLASALKPVPKALPQR
jgi:SAM-dependent methyltransferase